jgi:CRISPR-associated endonuclease Csn1
MTKINFYFSPDLTKTENLRSMKKVLGLDLGVASIGWSYIQYDEKESASILGMGVRVIPLFADERGEFSQGNSISKHQKRTLKRTLRKGYDRYQLRKYALRDALQQINALPDSDLFQLSAHQLYGLRDRATTEKISLKELGRIFLHLNQKRGYKSSRSDDQADTKQTAYVQEVNDRYKKIQAANLTVGQFFYRQLEEDIHIPIKGQVFPRNAYIEEFETIWKIQNQYYPELLTDDFREKIDSNLYEDTI